MANLANLNGITETLPTTPRLTSKQKTPKRTKVIALLGKKQVNFEQGNPLQTTRRLALGLASISLVGNSGNGVSLAEDNGFWQLDFPLNVSPTVENSKLSMLSFCFSLMLQCLCVFLVVHVLQKLQMRRQAPVLFLRRECTWQILELQAACTG